MEQKNNPIIHDFYLTQEAGFVPADQNKMKPAMLMDAVTFDGPDPDEMKYLLLIKAIEPSNIDDYGYEWFVKSGRQATYDFLKELLTSCIVDVDESFIMAESSTIKSAISIYKFMRNMKDGGKVIENTSFDPDEYRLGEYDTEETGSILDHINEDHGILYKYRYE